MKYILKQISNLSNTYPDNLSVKKLYLIKTHLLSQLCLCSWAEHASSQQLLAPEQQILHGTTRRASVTSPTCSQLSPCGWSLWETSCFSDPTPWPCGRHSLTPRCLLPWTPRMSRCCRETGKKRQQQSGTVVGHLSWVLVELFKN